MSVRLPAQSPNLNSFAERWVRSIKEECLSRLILFGETSLRLVLTANLVHYHAERNHQGRSNALVFPKTTGTQRGEIRCQERLGGLLRYYNRAA